jgi:S1-C subfamily serine protease
MESQTESNVERIILRHLTGSKRNLEERIELRDFSELNIGRSLSSDIRYNADTDDLVSGEHAKITRDLIAPSVFMLTDLGSRNGTFVNKQRVTSPVRVMPGDLIQFGAGGPELEFDVEPRPEGLLKRTRAAGSAALPPAAESAIPPTRTGPISNLSQASAQPNSSAHAHHSHTPIGKATLERALTDHQRKNRKQLLFGAAALLLLISVTAWVMRPHPCTDCPLAWEAIAETNRNAVVEINFSWKLINTKTGMQVYQIYVPNAWGEKDANGMRPRIVNDTRRAVAAYVVLDDGTYEPALTDKAEGNEPIVGSGGGTGFAATSDGFILTARHVGTNWMTKYQYPENAYPGVVFVRSSGGGYVMATNKDGSPQLVRPALDWVPGNTRQMGNQGMRWAVEGQHAYLNVTFPQNKTSIPAKLARVSDRHDVAMLKIDMPGAVAKCELYDNYETIKVGNSIAVLGYPAVSPIVYGRSNSQDMFNRESQNKIIPDPSLTTGNIGRVLRGSEGKEDVTSRAGDVYQVTANPGGGNSGGPVFDDRGRVIGIYFAGAQASGGQVSFAVPIRYALELMTTTPK